MCLSLWKTFDKQPIQQTFATPTTSILGISFHTNLVQHFAHMDLRAFKAYEGLYQNLGIGDGDDTSWE